MKTIIYLFISITLVIFTGCKSQQDPIREALNKAEQDALFENALQAVNDRDFVLEADRITFKYGRFAYVNSSTNFISLKKDKATIQMAFNSPYAGPNGIGGITVDGIASNIKIETDKKGNLSFRMTVQGVGISAEVSFNIIRGSNECSVLVNPNFNNNKTTFSGYLYPREESNIFKGRAL